MNIEEIKNAIKANWNYRLDEKACRYVGRFINRELATEKISADVEGNHGTYRVSITVNPTGTESACSCYIGKGGGCHHCEALAHTFLKAPESFQVIRSKMRKQIKTLDDLESFLKGRSLESLLNDVKASGITIRSFAESIGMNPKHLGSIRRCELRGWFYNELGATKLACLWVLEHLAPKGPAKKKTTKRA